MTGIRFLDHTADVGLEVEAPDPETLFHRAAVGLVALLAGREEELEAGSAVAEPRDVEGESSELTLEARGRAELLAAWLKELIYIHESRGLDYASVQFRRLAETELTADVELHPAPPAAREIKGVTYHELDVSETERGWTARMIFDV